MLNHRLRQASSQLSTYLPVLLMACLALGSWWLLRNAPSHQDPTSRLTSQRTEPDYFMHNFSVQAYNASGSLDHLLEAKEMLHMPADDSFRLTAPHFISIDAQGNRLTGEAQRGNTNGDGSVVELLDNAKVQRQAATQTPFMQFEGPQLRIYAKDKRVESDQAVRLTRGGSTFLGSSMRYDHIRGEASLGGPVRAHLPAGGT